MPLRALGVTAFLTLAAWGAWDWASSNGHATIGLIAGVLLVPAAVALAGFLALTAVGLGRRGAARAAARREQGRVTALNATPPPPSGAGETSSPATAGAPRRRIAV
jgi:TRAP-type C4-dicarboxylate transport system permease small subunit